MTLANGVWLINADGPHRVPNNPAVIAHFVARGYEVTDLPGEWDSDDPEFLDALEALQAEAPAAEPVENVEPVEAAESATNKEGTE